MKGYIYILSLAIAVVFPTEMSAQSENQRVEIPPLLKSQWGQQAPFYYKTPIINGEHAKTGCVATAMSQLIYFHKFPTQGKQDVFSFDNFTFNFANHTFDYEAMKETYDRNEDMTDPSVEAVANLMYACGVTANMDYGVESSSGNFSLIPKALNEWFLYPIDGMGMLLKDYFTLDEWENIVYEELEAGRPVLYMGGNGASSHVFVCDGYKEGKFHMNLGWYGEKNDYLPLSNLLTERVGKPGLWSMNSSQRIIRGIRLKDAPAPKPLATASTFSYDSDGDSFSLRGISCYVDGTSIIPGIKLTSAGDATEYVVWADSETIINRSTSTVSFNVSLSGIPEGSYTLRPVYRPASNPADTQEVYPVYCNILNTRYYTADISSGGIVNPREGSDIEVNVTASEYTPASTYIKGENYGYGFTVMAENTGNTTISMVGVKFCTPGTTDEVRSANFNESLAPGECKTIYLTIPYTAPAGEYDMWIYDNASKQPFCDPIRVILHNSNEIKTIEDSKFRYMPLAPDSDEAMILMSKTSTYLIENDGAVEIESEALIDGKKYKIVEIGPRLLYGRNDITSLTIPSTVRKIDVSAFAGCTNISEIKVEAETPPALHSSAFDRKVADEAKISVPEGSVELYKESPVWNSFTYTSEEEEHIPGSVYMSDFNIAPGNYFIATLHLDTDKEYYGCQFNLKVPSGLTIASDGVSVAEDLKAKGFTVGRSETNDDNKYTIVMYSSDNTAYPTGDTSILDIRFLADLDFKGGTVSISDILFSEVGEDNKFFDVAFEDTTCFVTSDIGTSVEAIISNNKLADIYNVSGVRIFSNVNPSEVMFLLAPGVYIVKNKEKSYKILKR